MSAKISNWLEQLGLGQYSMLFEENDLDWDILAELDQGTLKDIGIDSAGHRLQILKAIKNLKPEDPTPASGGDTEAQSGLNSSTMTESETAGWSRTPGERKPVTMLFADIVGSTSLTEALDAEDAHSLLYSATQAMCKAVENNKGTVCRFMGDGIMAMFGAPVASERHALEACRAASEMQANANKQLADSGENRDLDLQIRVGLHSGEVVVLDVGNDPENPEYDASGPTVPLAARMEQSAAAGTILMTAATRMQAGNLIEVAEQPAISVKGITELVEVFQLVNLLSATDASMESTRHTFVGRSIELAQFRSLLDTCVDRGHGHVVFVRGEAGIGKSRLVEELSTIAQQSGFQLHKVLVLDFGAGKGQEAIPALVRSLLGITAGNDKEQRRAILEKAENEGVSDPEQRVYLNDLLDLAQPLELRTLYDAMPAEVRGVGKRATVVALLSKLASSRRLLLVVEDLHWVDDITLEYLADITAAVAQCQALMVMTSRADGDPIDKTWRSRAGDSPVLTWDLGPLRKEESLNLVASFIDADDDLAKRCIERAAGNPLFLEQLLLNVSRSSTDTIPDSIKSLVLTRVDQLPEEDKQALHAAAVLGQRFALEGLRFLTGNANYECRNLIEHHLVRPDGSLYLFAHALIQEGAYASLLKSHRFELHRKAADWFKGHDAVLFAEHLDYAGDDEAAIAYLRAAQEQSAQYRTKRALQLVQRGLEIASDADSFSLECLEGELLRVLGSVSESIEAFTKAQDLANNDAERCQALVGVAEGQNITEAHDDLMQTLKVAENLANANSLAEELSCINHLRGGVQFFKSDTEASLQSNLTALKYAREAHSQETQARALSGLGDAEYSQGRHLTAQKYFEQCIELCQENGLGRIMAANLLMFGILAIRQNDLVAAGKRYHEVMELSTKTQNLRAEMINRVVGSYYWTSLGELEQAEECLFRGLSLSRQLGSRLLEGVMLQHLGRVYFHKGEQPQAHQYAEEALKILEESESGISFRGPAALGIMALTTDDTVMRQTALQQAEDLLDAGSISHNFFNFYEDAIEISLLTKNWDEADRYAARLEDYTRDEPVPSSDFYIARGRALAAFGRGERDPGTLTELQRLRDLAHEVGLKLALSALEAALTSARASQVPTD